MLSLAEAIRRFQWNFFRMENEHVNNCGQFRAVKDIPLPFMLDERHEFNMARRDHEPGSPRDLSEDELSRSDQEEGPNNIVPADDLIIPIIPQDPHPGLSRQDISKSENQDLRTRSTVFDKV